MGIRTVRLRRDTLRIEPPPSFMGAGRLVTPRPDPDQIAARWADSVRAALAHRTPARLRSGLSGLDSALLLVPRRPDAAMARPLPPSGAPATRAGALRQYVDLGLQLNARFEMRYERLRNLRCTAAEANQIGSSCRGGFTPPRLEPQFNVRTGGVVGQRVHLNVDYDSEREFEASNNIQLYYQGIEDEIIRRIEVGNVTFRAPGSRFITGGVPANNFGFQVEGQIGAVEWSGIYAQQKGNVVRDRTFVIGDQTLQPVDREAQDRDFEPLRFFFIVDPGLLPGYPAVDILNLVLAGLPADSRVTQVRVYRRRSTLGRTTAEQNLGGIDAVALRDDSPQRAGPFPWELLLEGRDYYLDPSGLWLALASRLDQEDFLAVSYVTAAGDTVGTFPAAQTAGFVDTLRLIFEPRRGPEVPTFRHEMRNIYRVGGVDDVTRESVGLRLLVGESERPASGAPTFLALLGLAQENDQTSFDQYNRLFPRQRDPGLGAPLRDFFVVFPHLTPFGDSVRLDPQFRNDSLYRTPTYLLRTQGPTPLHLLRLHYDARGGDDRSILSLGGFQIREGSEKIIVQGRQLVRNQDYTINYEVGQVTFLAPDSLFRQPTQVTVQYEENPAFAIAPTTVMGFQGRYDFGDRGALTALGLFQRERTTFTRPPLGFEPSSNFVGGIAGSFRFEPSRLTELLDRLPLVSASAPSTVTLDAEIATSRPSPNQLGVAYLETFESEGGLFVPLGENAWEFGSRPTSGLGLAGTGIDPVLGFSDHDAVPLVWQSLIATATGVVQFTAQQIDPSLRIQGAGQSLETVLWLTLYPDTVGGLPALDGRPRWLLPHVPGPRWRSITQPLSATGVDLTRVEFLEVWVLEDADRTARNAGASLVLDFGTVLEDAVDFLPTEFTVAGSDTTFAGRRRAGEGRLDTERDTLTNTFNAALDDTGILGDVADSIRDAAADTVVRDLPLCESELGRQLVVYGWGSLRVHCTRRNGTVDSEDLDNDGHLDTLVAATTEAVVRYVFPIGDDRFFVRDGGRLEAADTVAFQWRLYRIPFRSDTVQIGTPNLRLVRSLRMTVVAPDAPIESTLRLALARMKLVSAPWVKRAGTPIANLYGNQGVGRGEVIASVISTENRADLGYESPPGVIDQGEVRGGELQIGTREINERSLRLIGRQVEAGERAEAYFQFPEGERNLLGYRQLRVWARGRGPGWDESQLSFYIKIGQDANNFYLYRAPARTTTWTPEVVVEFGRWLTLRAEIEERYLRGEPPAGASTCGGDTLAYVACDGPYLVHVRSPGIAPPNLTRVQELAAGFLRDSGAATDSTELWVDDIRLTGVVDDPGYAGAVNLRVVASDLGDLTLALTRRDGNFRQLGDDPPYVTTSNFSLATTVRLDKLGLDRLGLTAPFSFRTDRSSSDPFYLNRTDVLAAGLDGLRRPRTGNTAYSLSLRRSRRGTAWWQRAFSDNIGLSGSFVEGNSTTELSQTASRVTDIRADYSVQPGARAVSYVPGFLRDLLRGLPRWLRRTEMIRGLEGGGRLRWTPAQISLLTSFNRARSDRRTFRRPVETAEDTLNPPVMSLASTLRTTARIEVRPFNQTSLGLDLVSDRDLRDYGDTTTVGVLTRQQGRGLLGIGVGFERARSLNTRLSWQPALVSWARPRFSTTSSFSLTRDPNSRVPERETGDSSGAFRIPTAFTRQRAVELGGSLDLARLFRGLFGDSSIVRQLFDRINQVDISTRVDRRSQFDRPGFDPGFGVQLALGGQDDFRRQRERLANSASETRSRTLTTGVRLPFNTTLTGRYTNRRTLSWSLRGAQQQELRVTDQEWPDLTLRWSWTPQSRALRRILTSVNANVSLRVRESETVQPSLQPESEEAGSIRTNQENRSLPVSVSVSLAARVNAALSLGRDRSVGERSGNFTRNQRDRIGADVSFSFRFPRDLVPLPSDVRTTIRFDHTRNRTCVQRSGSLECIPVSDSRRREYNLTMDTDLPPNVTAGLSAGYVLTQDAHVNRKFSQFVLTANVSVSLQAGELR
jgi:hypothetical protein